LLFDERRESVRDPGEIGRRRRDPSHPGDQQRKVEGGDGYAAREPRKECGGAIELEAGSQEANDGGDRNYD
jgi:hypothetical protein